MEEEQGKARGGTSLCPGQRAAIRECECPVVAVVLGLGASCAHDSACRRVVGVEAGHGDMLEEHREAQSGMAQHGWGPRCRGPHVE